MDDEAETYKIWKIRKTVMQICHDRGYLVTQVPVVDGKSVIEDGLKHQFLKDFWSHNVQIPGSIIIFSFFFSCMQGFTFFKNFSTVENLKILSSPKC